MTSTEPIVFGRSDKHFATERPLKILIAEDHYISRRLMLLMLASLGYQAEAVENGREAFEAVLTSAYDVLLTDVDMPEMSGIECAVCIREATLELPIIAVSASEPQYTREQCLSAGMNGYLKKPVILDELKRALAEVALRKWVSESNVIVSVGG
jgi:CheY-like chemotaxis protein